ncbi:hypothetical protein [Gordonia aurantiaca]|uniref:hypothetical protein n=1 Tax=Gordonia sp. B21 TaxID=3151852 RepID=UPI0032673F55
MPAITTTVSTCGVVREFAEEVGGRRERRRDRDLPKTDRVGDRPLAGGEQPGAHADSHADQRLVEERTDQERTADRDRSLIDRRVGHLADAQDSSVRSRIEGRHGA